MVATLKDSSAFLVFENEDAAKEAGLAIDNAKLLKNAAVNASEQGPGTYFLVIRVEDDKSVRLNVVKA